MVSLLFFVAGIVGGAISVAFLISIAFVEPLAFVILAGISWGVWKWAGKGMDKWWASGYMAEEPMINDDVTFTGTSLDEDPTEEDRF